MLAGAAGTLTKWIFCVIFKLLVITQVGGVMIPDIPQSLLNNPEKENLIRAGDAKETKARPQYYHLEKGFAARVSEFFEKPKEMLESFENQREMTKLDVVASAVLKLPAIIGSAISRLIYFINGEKIKQSDYNDAYAEWMKKAYIYTDEKLIKRFIDTCIHHRIKAEECPYQIIAERLVDRGSTLLVLNADGCAGHAYDSMRDKNLNLLILMGPQDRTQGWKDTSSKKLKDILTERVGADENKRQMLQTRCQAVWFNMWTPKDTDTVGSLKEAITKLPSQSNT